MVGGGTIGCQRGGVFDPRGKDWDGISLFFADFIFRLLTGTKRKKC